MQIRIFSFFSFLSFCLLLFSTPTTSDPQTQLLLFACSTVNVTNLSAFYTNLNDTFSEIRSQLNSSHFVTSTKARVSNPVYTLFQCRNYLSASDCMSCFTYATNRIRNCSNVNGGRALFEGCFLRYESNNFFDQGSQPGYTGFCGNRTSKVAGFNQTATALLADIVVATPRIKGFWAAVRQERIGGGGPAYGVAQCVESLTESVCADCLNVAHQSIEICPPDGNGTAVDAGCFLRYSDTAFFSVDQTVDILPYLKEGGGSNKKKAIIGVVVGGVALLILLALLWILLLRRSKKKEKTQQGDILGATELRGPMNFHYRDLKSATKNFSEENRLGGGGFGDVYKGVLKNGKIVAVKKLMVGQSAKEKATFESEAKLISNVHHRNLIRLLGCCRKGTELLLVYEYMANGSLDTYLFGDRLGTLNWKQRFDIILGTARAVSYLHEEFHACIIHRDIKASNILIDNELQPKISDFGLARLLPDDRSHLSTKFAGTLGYAAPEYAIHGQLSEKVDTYSYGVVALEIISGLKSIDMKREPTKQYLLEWAWSLYENRKLMELIDPNLDPTEYNAEEVKKVIEISLTCTQTSLTLRPTMSEVVVSLLSKGDSVHELTRPAFIDVAEDANGNEPNPASHATMSMTFSAR